MRLFFSLFKYNERGLINTSTIGPLHKGIQNRLTVKAKIQYISRYIEAFSRYLGNLLGYLDIF